MKTKKDHALEILQKKILSNPHFDRTNYDKNIGTLRWIKVYYNNWEKYEITKITRSTFKGKMVNTKLKNSNGIFDAIARYFFEKNYIIYNNLESNKEILLHELVHMSTYSKEKNNSGLCYNGSPRERKGNTPLNEGITQWLTCKTLYGNDDNNEIYRLETRIARLIEIATSEEQVLKHFSQINYRTFNHELSTDKSNRPLKKIATWLDNIDYVKRFHDDLSDIDVNDKEKEEIIYNIYYIIYMDLKSIQRYITDLYFMKEENISNEDKNIEFMDSLITQDVTNSLIFKLYKPVLKNNYDALNYYKIQLKKHNKELYNGLFKSSTK